LDGAVSAFDVAGFDGRSIEFRWRLKLSQGQSGCCQEDADPMGNGRTGHTKMLLR
jgi:hypothetical protein